MTSENYTSGNVGLAALEKVYKDLQIDDQWSEIQDNEFSWIAYRLSQSVKISEPREDNGVILYQVTAETLVVENIQAPDSKVLWLLAEVNRNAFGSCYIFYPDEKKIYANTFCWVHKETLDWRIQEFGLYVIGQLTFAEMEADFLASKLSADIAERVHKISGKREYRDDMLNLVGSLIFEHGQQPSRFANAFEMQTIEDIAHQSPYAATLGASEEGIALETSFGDYTSFSALSPVKRHRLLGNGLIYKTMLPTNISFDEGSRISNMLNRKYRDENPENQHFGAWCVDKSSDESWVVSYNGFLPNLIHRNGMSMDTSYVCINTARWVDYVMHSDISTPNAWEKLKARMKKIHGDKA